MIKANYDDKPLVVDILSESFNLNKSVNYIIKQNSQRRRKIRRLMEYSFELCYMFGEVYLSDDKKGCALIMFPERKKTTLKTIILDAKFVLSCIGLTGIFKVLDRESKIKSNHPSDPFIYLWFIGVMPGFQQRGTGSALLNRIIQKAIISQRSIYLETSMQENIAFYIKHGFEVYKELKFSYSLFLMRKEFRKEKFR